MTAPDPSEGRLIADYVANLGLATTLDLLNELYVRFEVPTPDTLARETVLRLIEDLPDRTLNYRTVDS